MLYNAVRLSSKPHFEVNSGLTAAAHSLKSLKRVDAFCAALASHGLSLAAALFVHLYLVRMEDFGAANKAYGHYFPAVSPPARACVQGQLPPGVDVMVDVLLVHGELLNGAMSAYISCGLHTNVSSLPYCSSPTPTDAGSVSQHTIATTVYRDTSSLSLALIFEGAGE